MNVLCRRCLTHHPVGGEHFVECWGEGAQLCGACHLFHLPRESCAPKPAIGMGAFSPLNCPSQLPDGFVAANPEQPDMACIAGLGPSPFMFGGPYWRTSCGYGGSTPVFQCYNCGYPHLFAVFREWERFSDKKEWRLLTPDLYVREYEAPFSRRGRAPFGDLRRNDSTEKPLREKP